MVIVKIYIIANALVRIQAIEKLDEEKAESNHKDTIFNTQINKHSHLFKLSSHTQNISALPRKYSRFSTRC